MTQLYCKSIYSIICVFFPRAGLGTTSKAIQYFFVLVKQMKQSTLNSHVDFLLIVCVCHILFVLVPDFEHQKPISMPDFLLWRRYNSLYYYSSAVGARLPFNQPLYVLQTLNCRLFCIIWVFSEIQIKKWFKKPQTMFNAWSSTWIGVAWWWLVCKKTGKTDGDRDLRLRLD